jgi:hypothetical protein
MRALVCCLAVALPSIGALAQAPSQSHGVAPVAKKAGAAPAASAAARASATPRGGFSVQARPRRVRQAQVVVLLPNGAPAPVTPESLACTSVQDCGDGELGHGAVCDRASFELGIGAAGVCREACRDANDCPAGNSCVAGLDPDDTDWLGCVP